ncbi:MAG: alpha/beta hydrolase [Microcella sp.]|uniref:esterase/lipase family protein n=1 Tax=Microcella sp. TaxID=1913979 RepID=UPI00331533FA
MSDNTHTPDSAAEPDSAATPAARRPRRPGPARSAAGLAADLAYVARSRLGPLRYGMLPPPPNDPSRDAARLPVLLIPGVFESWHYLRTLGERLAARGHPVHRVAELGLNRHPIEHAAHLLTDYVRERDLRDVALVCHSKGGLIGKAMLIADAQSAPDQRRLTRLVTVNTPFAGTPVARWGLGPWREFRPESAIIRTLDARTDVNDRITSLVSAVDQYVPRAIAHLDGAENVVLDRVGHFRVLGLPDVIDEIERRLP